MNKVGQFGSLGNFRFKPIRIKPFTIKPIKTPMFGGKTFQESGKDFEKRVKKHFLDKGYNVSKAHNRHYDFHARKNGKTYYIEAKCTTARLSHQELDLMHKVTKQGDVYVVALKSKTGRIKLKFYR